MVAIPSHVLLVGFGRTNQAVARALLAREHRVEATDDQPGAGVLDVAAAIGVELTVAPNVDRLAQLMRMAGAVVPGPGLADRHPVFALAADLDVALLTEFDLAATWDPRPIAAITGTDGKTTVTTMVTAMLNEAGIACVDAGNNDLPLVAAIDDPMPDWFVVEASSFRLGRSHDWAPRVGTWLNLAPDHLDVHATAADYEAAKARIWTSQSTSDVAVGNLDDPVVRRHLAGVESRPVSFSIIEPAADYKVTGPASGSAALAGPAGPFVGVDELPRALPHDLSNALAAAATAHAAGADDGAVAAVLRRSRPLPHRVQLVATIDGVSWYDDSKATVPHATLAAVRGFEHVVLIAGGRNKGLDLGELADGVAHVRAVVAIGEASAEVEAAFDGLVPVEIATSMEDAVAAAARRAVVGDAVLLSPACASFDWYADYAARGDDFTTRVLERKARS
ncbi:MAG: UDP-N-acetylmuramoyl-L-alanine--D-glutamate ligase [Acidimicrobiales bacterium]|nr:UDP-N-acetylmuramoyl-L-alanine--D-glutamate ligase [Acidimicrobiales bacterium]